MNSRTLLLVVLLAIVCFTLARSPRLTKDKAEGKSKDAGVWLKRGKKIIEALKQQSQEESWADSESTPGQAAANWARSKAGGCYSQTKRDGNPCYDCSSLVYYAWRAAGKNIGATNTRMYPGNTHRVSASSLQPGDILWRSGHVGMYLGAGKYVNAENPANGIQVRTFNAAKWTTFYRPN